MQLKILRLSALKQLREDIKGNVDVYVDGEISRLAITDSPEYVVETGIEINENVADLISLLDKEDKRDKENCISIYEALKSLTPYQASEERVWTYLTHFVFWDYTRARWPVSERKEKESEEAFRKRKIRHIKSHYFANSARELIRGNAISRLWWMGRIAERCNHFPLKKTLNILLKQSDVRKNLLERPTLSMSKDIFNAIILALDKYGLDKKGKNGLDLFERRTFREFMNQLNRIGGTLMLNSLPEESLQKLIESVYSTVSSSPATGS